MSDVKASPPQGVRHAANRCRMSITVALITVFPVAACERPEVPIPTEPGASMVGRGGVAITETVPRAHMPLERILEALQDTRQTDGTLLVGVKEPGAIRGVSTTGTELPFEARFAAEEAIRRDFPGLEVIRGIRRPVIGTGSLGAV